MAILSGKRLGPYEILSAIGAGGMGEVYRARDTPASNSFRERGGQPSVAGVLGRRQGGALYCSKCC
jgi:serine/threonine protein kinase